MPLYLYKYLGILRGFKSSLMFNYLFTMEIPLNINKSEYELIQNYLRLNIESIKFDNQKFSDENFKAYKSLNQKLNSIDFDLF